MPGKFVLATALLTCLPLASVCAAMLPETQASISVAYDDNLNNSSFESDQISSAVYRFGWQRRDELWTGRRVGTELACQLQTSRVDSPGRLSSGLLSLNPNLWWQLGDGFFAPSLRLSGQLGWREYDSRLRDGYWYGLRLVLVTRLTTQFTVQAHAAGQRRWADAREFEGRKLNAGLGLQWQPWSGYKLFLSGQYVRRDIDASMSATLAQASGITLPWIDDDALAGNWVYRLDVDGAAYQAGFSGPLFRSFRWNLSYALFDQQTRDYVFGPTRGRYRREQTALNLVFNY